MQRSHPSSRADERRIAVTERALAGRTALITGAGQNIGRAIALAFADLGARVVLNGRRDAAKLEAVSSEISARGGEAMVVLADVGNPEDVQRMIDAAVGVFGSVDISVANAAIRPHQPFLDITVEDWRHVIETNLSSAFYLAKAVIPGMKQRGWGRIIHISGRDGFIVKENRAHNVACKAGIHALAKAIALEFGPFGITANTVAPGIIDTSRDPKNYPDWDQVVETRVAAMPVRRIGTVEDISNACVYLATDAGSFVTGQVLHLNGGEFML